jgi:hypothetical protein
LQHLSTSGIGIFPLLEAGEEGLGPTPAEVLQLFFAYQKIGLIFF